MRAIFVQIKCEMGEAYKVAREAADTIEQMSELYSTSGQYDLLGKFYLEPEQDIGLFVTEKIQTSPGCERHLHADHIQRVQRRPKLNYLRATQSISTSAPRANAVTPTQVRAGRRSGRK